MSRQRQHAHPDADAPSAQPPLRMHRLTTSYRFDAELARLLTAFQYGEDGITLTAPPQRPVPTAAFDSPTVGLASVLTAGASLVFVCYDERGHRMVNPIETKLVAALADAFRPSARTARSTERTAGPLGEEPTAGPPRDTESPDDQYDSTATAETGAETPPSMGVVTPHNAQRGALETVLPDGIAANTVEKYQGGERDIIAVSATVSDPEFARKEERFILNPRRLLVAISRARLLTVVVCSRALFEVAPEDSDRLDEGPIWARLFTLAVGRDAEPAWSGSLGAFTPTSTAEQPDVPVAVYPSTITTGDTGGEQR